jgi:hypothetical protein
VASANPKAPRVTFEEEPSHPTSSSTQLKNLDATAKTASAAPQANSEGGAMQPPDLKRLLSETRPLDSTDTKPQLSVVEKETSPTFDSTRPGHAEPAAEIHAAAPPRGAEDATPPVGKSLLADLHTSRSLDWKASPAIFSGNPDQVGPAIEIFAATFPANAATGQHSKTLPLTDPPALVSTPAKSSFTNFEQDMRPSSLTSQPDSVVPLQSSIGDADPTGAEGARPQHLSSLLAALRVLTARPSPPVVENGSTLASQPDNAGMLVETVAHQSDAKSALVQPTKSLLTEMRALVSTDAKSTSPTFEEKRWRPPVPDQPANEVPTPQAVAVASSADTENAVKRAQQGKSLLAELDLNTAIRLRWVMRDIRSKRTKFSPVSADDLTALLELGLVEIRDEIPRLTGLGFLALD